MEQPNKPPAGKAGKTTWRWILLISTVYLVLAVLFTWPLTARLSTHCFGVDEDSAYHIWHNWWLKYAIFDLKQSPLNTNYIFHPQTIPLAFDANAFVFGALTIPIQLITGNVVLASNVIFLLSFILSGISMYLLAHYTSRHRFGSFIAGIIYAFAPYVFAQAIDGHTNLISIWIIPLYALALIKLWKSPRTDFCHSVHRVERPSATTTKRTAVLIFITGFLLALQAYNDLTYTAFTIFLTGLFILAKIAEELWHTYENRQCRPTLTSDTSRFRNLIDQLTKPLISLLLAGIVSLALFSPVLVPTLKVYSAGVKPDAPLWVQAVWSADVLSFFRPPSFLKVFPRKWVFTAKQGTVEGTVFPGYLPLVFLSSFLLTAIAAWRKRREIDTTSAYWLLVTLSFALFSLGPWLRINHHQPTLTLLGKQIPLYLPFVFLHKIPLIGGTQEPTRMNPFIMLGLGLIVAKGIKAITQGWQKVEKPREWQIYIFYASLLAFAIGERLPSDFPTTDLRAPEVYYQIAKEPGEFAVLSLPVGFNSGNIALGQSPTGSLQYYQAIHHQPSFRGTVARLPSWAFDYYRELPLFAYFINPSQPLREQDLDPMTVRQTFIDQLHVKYIVIHKNKYRQVPLGQTEKLIEKVLKGKKVWEEGEISAYKI